MKKEWLVKIIALGILVLFVGVSFQPIIAEKTVSVEKESDIENVDFKEAKEYLFQTIIDIADNPNVKILFKQYNHKIFTFDYDYKGVFLQLFLKKPKLFLSIFFTKPSITYDYLDKSYDRGIECVNILGEKQILGMTDFIKISNPDLLNELNKIIKNDKELSNRILTLEIMNNDLKLDSPFMGYPIICGIIEIIFGSIIGFLYYCADTFYHFNPILFFIFNNLHLIFFGLFLILAIPFDCIGWPY